MIRLFIFMICIFILANDHSFAQNSPKALYKQRKLKFDHNKYAHIFFINANLADIQIIAGKTLENRAMRSSGLFLEDYMEASSSAMALSGGYMLSFSPPTPLGYVRIRGRELSHRHISWLMGGYFCTTGREFSIREGNGKIPDKDAGDCIQAGPMIIKNGENRYDRNIDILAGEKKLIESEQAHVILCLKNVDKISVVFADNVRLDKISEFLSRRRMCDSALRLTGHITGGVKTKSYLYGYDEVPIPSAIVIKEATPLNK